jgi:hypothetical protein
MSDGKPVSGGYEFSRESIDQQSQDFAATEEGLSGVGLR